MASIISAGTTSGTALNMSADTSGILALQTSGTTALTVGTTHTTTLNSASASPSLITQVNGTETARFDASGNLQLGYGIAPTTASAPAGMSLCCPANSQLQLYFLKNTQIESHIGFKSGSDGNFYVGTAGGVNGIGTYGLYQANTGTSWIAVSDERFKTNLQPITNALEKISKVRAVTGRYTYDEDKSKSRPFLIAQDFLTALPEAVDQKDPEKLGLSYSDTIPLLVAAIKELKAEIDLLKGN
jgi:hypothetical protein